MGNPARPSSPRKQRRGVRIERCTGQGHESPQYLCSPFNRNPSGCFWYSTFCGNKRRYPVHDLQRGHVLCRRDLCGRNCMRFGEPLVTNGPQLFDTCGCPCSRYRRDAHRRHVLPHEDNDLTPFGSVFQPVPARPAFSRTFRYQLGKSHRRHDLSRILGLRRQTNIRGLLSR